MTIVAFVSSKKSGQLVDVSTDGKFSVVKVCDMRQRRNKRNGSQNVLAPAVVFESNYDSSFVHESTHLSKSAAKEYTRLSATKCRGNLVLDAVERQVFGGRKVFARS